MSLSFERGGGDYEKIQNSENCRVISVPPEMITIQYSGSSVVEGGIITLVEDKQENIVCITRCILISIYLYISLSICLSIYIIYLSMYLSIYRYIYRYKIGSDRMYLFIEIEINITMELHFKSLWIFGLWFWTSNRYWSTTGNLWYFKVRLFNTTEST